MFYHRRVDFGCGVLFDFNGARFEEIDMLLFNFLFEYVNRDVLLVWTAHEMFYFLKVGVV